MLIHGIESQVFALSHRLSIHLANLWCHHPLLPMFHVREGNCSLSVEATPSFTSTILPFCSAKHLSESDPGILLNRFTVLALTCANLETGNNMDLWLHCRDEQATAQSGDVIPTVSNENAIKAHSLLLRYTQQ